MTDLITRYLAVWNETDVAVRRDLIAEVFAPEASYVDPLVEVAGHAAIDAVVGAVHGQFPGFVFTQLGAADSHHAQVRFAWGLGPAGGDPVVEGFDVALLDDDGRISRVLGFLDKVPAPAS